jgi:glycosyltransferase involved in cell wall biosynthesis
MLTTSEPQAGMTEREQTSAVAPTIKLLAVMEPKTVTGAAKNMLDFCRFARDLKGTLPGEVTVETSILTFERGPGSQGLQRGANENAQSLMESPNEFVKAARELGLEVDIVPERFRFDLRVIPGLRANIERRAPDIVLTHHVKSHFLMKLSRLWQKYPWVAFHHGYTKTHLREQLYNRMDRLSLPTARRVITVCEAFARELRKAGVAPERISVQHNSISREEAATADEVQAVKTRFGIAEGEPIVLAIGRLSSEKAHIDLLAAFRHLLKVNPESRAKLIIVGDGPERSRLEAAVLSYGINTRVHFAGQISNVKPYYAAAKVLVLPSHSEGSPYVLLEAMAAGLAIVATKVGGVPEMVEDEESALLVALRDSEMMAGAISRVLTEDGLARKLTLNASALVNTRYSPETYVRSLVEIYRGVISSAASRDKRVV